MPRTGSFATVVQGAGLDEELRRALRLAGSHDARGAAALVVEKLTWLPSLAERILAVGPLLATFFCPSALYLSTIRGGRNGF